MRVRTEDVAASSSEPPQHLLHPLVADFLDVDELSDAKVALAAGDQAAGYQAWRRCGEARRAWVRSRWPHLDELAVTGKVSELFRGGSPRWVR
jgi:hypothetical protein